jgi:hypothetical protein
MRLQLILKLITIRFDCNLIIYSNMPLKLKNGNLWNLEFDFFFFFKEIMAGKKSPELVAEGDDCPEL